MEPTCSRDKSPSPSSLFQKHCAEGTGRHRRCCGSAQTGIEGITDGIAEEVGRKDTDEDADPGQKDQPDGMRQVLLGIAQHVGPTWRRWMDAEAQVVQRRLARITPPTPRLAATIG